MRDFLMAAQVAVSLVLLIAGSMLIRSSIRAVKMDTGYDSKHVVSLELRFPEGQKYNAGRQAALVRELRTRLSPFLAWLRLPAHGRRTAADFEQLQFRKWRKTLAAKYASDPLLHLHSVELLSNAGNSAAVRARISSTSRPV